MSETRKCIRCLKPARLWTGHVAKGKERVTAGWCSRKCLEAWDRRIGLKSVWIKAFGQQRDPE